MISSAKNPTASVGFVDEEAQRLPELRNLDEAMMTEATPNADTMSNEVARSCDRSSKATSKTLRGGKVRGMPATARRWCDAEGDPGNALAERSRSSYETLVWERCRPAEGGDSWRAGTRNNCHKEHKSQTWSREPSPSEPREPMTRTGTARSSRKSCYRGEPVPRHREAVATTSTAQEEAELSAQPPRGDLMLRSCP